MLLPLTSSYKPPTEPYLTFTSYTSPSHCPSPLLYPILTPPLPSPPAQCLRERMNAVSEASRLLWGSDCPPEVMAMRRDIVGFHGEMVLLLNYSSLNFMGEHCTGVLVSREREGWG